MNIDDTPVGLTFDDVLLVPQYSDIGSRSDVNLSSNTLLGELHLPLLSSPMDSISEVDLCIAMANCGGRGIFHRFMSREKLTQQVEQFEKAFPCNNPKDYLILSVGVGSEAKKLFDTYLKYKTNTICIDIANGFCEKMLDMISYIKDDSPHIKIIAGNICTKEGATFLLKEGADIIRCGIGNGSTCTTRCVTGHGSAQLTALQEVSEAIDDYVSETGRVVELISDGGVKSSGCIAKALVFSDYVMTGSLLSATDETPGEKVESNGILCKVYRGMSSKEVNKELGKSVAAEGVVTLKSCKGPVANVMRDIEWGLRSALTYSGARNLKEFRAKAKFRRVSSHSYVEGTPHGLLTL